MYNIYPCPYYPNPPMNNYNNMSNIYPTYHPTYPCPYLFNTSTKPNVAIELRDYGPEPFVVNIKEATKKNTDFRMVLWTGGHLQLTLMSIKVGEDIGLEIHPNLDQFIRIEEGQGIVEMGDTKNNLDFQSNVYDDFVFIIPAGKWHNLINTGNKPLKLYSIYAPPQHPHGTIHQTKAIAQAAEERYGH